MRVAALRMLLVAGVLGLQGCKSLSSFESELTVALVSVTTGIQHSCGLSQSGTAYCWGWNQNGQLGDGSMVDKPVPVRVDTDQSFVSIVAGGGHTCGITTGGTTMCWGLNLSGQVGDGSTADRSRPVPVVGGAGFVQLFAGGTYTCALNAAGSASCWGWNGFGQLGDGTTADVSAPVAVAAGLAFDMISPGNRHTCGVTVTAEAHCWGSNTRGQLGNGTLTQNSPSPVLVTGGLTWLSLASGEDHTCGLASTGVVHCWGGDDFGETALSGGADVPVPTAIVGGLLFDGVTANGGYSCGLISGQPYCWGINDLGQHGSLSPSVCNSTDPTGLVINQFPCATTPTAASSNLRFSQLDTGAHHACGVLTGAPVVYCWGSGREGQLGNGEDGDLYFTIEPQLVLGQPGG